ncbi:GDSL-type esterase/lipase family protein [Pseudonocardia acidicola]|uniref:SGNH/GDSL hydrolase family protein n=1 Tax=Pseudonocardia acidicola TaxID=2724939 RepID=A0ABX1SHF2_9PSEU|nr:SGNH/GDSL hydrolase family protein [Pseudonocardia acidicola]
MHPYRSFVAIGDSFTEGVGDELPDGTVRGWADLVARGLQAATEERVRYANLAIRGRLLAPIVGEQLPAALELGPDLLSLNGGGNDVLRPRVTVDGLSESMRLAAAHALESGVHVLMPTGVDPTARLPLGRAIRRRGAALAEAVRSWAAQQPGVTFVDNWNDEQLQDPRCWAPDRLHLSVTGHRRVAENTLRTLGIGVPDALLQISGATGTPSSDGLRYYTQYVLPWVGRRLRGRSSGDGRVPKQATLAPVPQGAVRS